MADKFKPGDWVIDTINDREVVVLGRFPADYPGIASTYEVMRPFDSDGNWHQPYGQGVQFLRKKSEFKVGDKVRPIAGEVIDTDSNNNHIRVKWDDGYGWFESKLLELVERPKKEPKLGSVWICKIGRGRRKVYVGGGFYAEVGSVNDDPRYVVTQMDIANHPGWELDNDNA